MKATSHNKSAKPSDQSLLSIALPDDGMSPLANQGHYADLTSSDVLSKLGLFRDSYQQATHWLLPLAFFMSGMMLMVYIIHIS